MGCGGSKVSDLPLVTHCRERKELIKVASEQRFALSSAHVAYFRSLEVLGDTFSKFIEEELVIGVSTPPDSPVLKLHSDVGKKKKINMEKHESWSSASSVSQLSSSLSNHNPPVANHEEEDSHLHLSSGSDLELDSVSSSGHIHIVDCPKVDDPYSSSYYQSRDGWSYYNNAYYMKNSSTAIRSVFYKEPKFSSVRRGDSSGPYSINQPYDNEHLSGFPMGSPPMGLAYNNQHTSVVPPPPSPNVSAWDFLNPFNMYDDVYGSYSGHLRGTISSSPDSEEVRRMEGIPELEEEFEHVPLREDLIERKLSSKDRDKLPDEETFRQGPLQNSVQHSHAREQDIAYSSMSTKEEINDTSADSIVSKNSEERGVGKKEGISEVESSKHSGMTTTFAHGTRDLHDVVKEIKSEFERASGIGKEIDVLLEVERVPYQSRHAVFRAILSRILYFIVPLSVPPASLASSTMKKKNTYRRDHKNAKNMKPCSLSTILEKLYIWEKKLYKEVKDEERLRIIYERKCKRLKLLDARGADSSKIDAMQASIKKFLTKINVCIRGIGVISSQINRLRDEELQPQLNELISGWTRMWRLMLKCHQNQYKAMMESKQQNLRVKGTSGLHRDSSLRAALELEMELIRWSTLFSDWITKQRSYVESLNGWLLRFLCEEQDVETPDGIPLFSPSQVGAPPIFVTCNDWCNAMQSMEERSVGDAVEGFAKDLHHLCEKLEQEQNQGLKAENLSKDVEKQLKMVHMVRERVEEHNDGSLVVPSVDDLRVGLDLMKKRLREERVKHKGAIKSVNDAVSGSIQAGLVPIFEALTCVSSEALKDHEQVRIQNAGKGEHV